MKIVTLLGSPRPAGNSTAIARRITETAAGLGSRTRTFELNRLSYRGCQGCYSCKKELDRCVLRDDLAEVLEAVAAADGVVHASPVYFGDVTAQMKGFIDRTFSYLKPDYVVNPKPSRLSPKKLVFVLTQGHPDEKMFGDVYPRFAGFLQWLGFAESRLVRVCGVGPGMGDRAPDTAMKEAEEAARFLAG